MAWSDTVKDRLGDWIVALLVAVGAIVLAIWERWPFDAHPLTIDQIESPSVWQYLFADQTTLGLGRLALGAASLFLVASLAALAFDGRWMTGLGGADLR